jgi:hypothetical protein
MNNNGGDMPVWLFLTVISLPLATIVLVFAIRAVARVLEARARLANDDAYRALVEKAAAAQAESGAALVAVRGELQRMAQSLSAVEKMLKQVD